MTRGCDGDGPALDVNHSPAVVAVTPHDRLAVTACEPVGAPASIALPGIRVATSFAGQSRRTGIFNDISYDLTFS